MACGCDDCKSKPGLLRPSSWTRSEPRSTRKAQLAPPWYMSAAGFLIWSLNWSFDLRSALRLLVIGIYIFFLFHILWDKIIAWLTVRRPQSNRRGKQALHFQLTFIEFYDCNAHCFFRIIRADSWSQDGCDTGAINPTMASRIQWTRLFIAIEYSLVFPRDPNMVIYEAGGRPSVQL